MALKFVDEVELEGKKIIARFDFNVPLRKEDGKMVITDTSRVDAAMRTIRYALEQGASKLVLMSHLGRPKGKRVEDMSLEPVANYLAEQLGRDVVLTESCTDRGIKTLLGLNETKVVLLENLRFHPEEEKNDRDFAKTLASYGDVYVNDAFGAAHRKHASTYEINAFFKNQAVGGFLLKDEIKSLEKVVETPQKPFVAILGGAKVSDKIKIIQTLLPKVNHLLIGGAMAYPFLKAKGYSVGSSLCEEDDVQLANQILRGQGKEKVHLPVDHIVSSSPEGDGEATPGESIPDDLMGLDIGAKTLDRYRALIQEAKTVLWNGPMGLFEKQEYAKGTFSVAKSVAEVTQRGAFSLVGGGDSVSAVHQSGLGDQFSHVSTGGGASLEYIEKGSLPGIQALKFGLD